MYTGTFVMNWDPNVAILSVAGLSKVNLAWRLEAIRTLQAWDILLCQPHLSARWSHDCS